MEYLVDLNEWQTDKGDVRRSSEHEYSGHIQASYYYRLACFHWPIERHIVKCTWRQ